MANIRKFATGATRDVETGKLDIEAFNSAIVDLVYAEFMDDNRIQTNGERREGDNWQAGFPEGVAMKSLTRHFTDVRLHFDGYGSEAKEDLQTSLCAVIFNAKAMLLEDINKNGKRKRKANRDKS